MHGSSAAGPPQLRGIENLPPAGGPSIAIRGSEVEGGPALRSGPVLTALTCPPGGSPWAVMAPELGPMGTVCTDRLSAAQLGPSVCLAPACVLEEMATCHCHQPPGPACRVGRLGGHQPRHFLPPLWVLQGRGAPGRPGGERGCVCACARPHPRALEAPTDLGGHGGSPGPRWQILPAPCPSPRERPRGSAQVSLFIFLRERLRFLCGWTRRPLPTASASPPRTVTAPFQASRGLVGRAEDVSPRVTGSDAARGRGSLLGVLQAGRASALSRTFYRERLARSLLPPACASRPNLYFIFVCVIFALCIK